MSKEQGHGLSFVLVELVSSWVAAWGLGLDIAAASQVQSTTDHRPEDF